VAKIYHPRKHLARTERKLKRMIANPPKDPARSLNHVSIAWPQELLYARQSGGDFVGYLMPRVQGRTLVHWFNPRLRSQQLSKPLSPAEVKLYSYRIARNLAAVVEALHDKGYVIGDLNESNVLVNEQALVSVIDTDSFQVSAIERSGDMILVFPCPVGKPEYTAPELQGRPFASQMRQADHDRFALAVLLFQILLDGNHPYRGIWRGQGDPPNLSERIRQELWPYNSRLSAQVAPPPGLAPLSRWIPAEIETLFRRCFEGKSRPTAREWRDALAEQEARLQPKPPRPPAPTKSHSRLLPALGSVFLLGLLLLIFWLQVRPFDLGRWPFALPPPIPALMTYGIGNHVTDLAVDGAVVWAATTSGVMRWNTQTGEYVKLTTEHGLAADRVAVVTIAPDGSVWFGTWGGGVSRWMADGRWETFTAANGLAYDDVPAIAATPDGSIWFGTWGGGVSRRTADGQWETFTLSDGLASSFVRTIAVAPDGSVWFGTSSGVSRRTADGQWERFTAANGLASNFVRTIAFSPDGSVWVGTRDGVSRRTADGRWEAFTAADGLVSDNVRAVAVAPDGSVWFGTSDGVSRRTADGRWMRFTTVNGLVNNFVEAIAIAPDGSVWFGTERGVSVLSP